MAGGGQGRCVTTRYGRGWAEQVCQEEMAVASVAGAGGRGKCVIRGGVRHVVLLTTTHYQRVMVGREPLLLLPHITSTPRLGMTLSWCHTGPPQDGVNGGDTDGKASDNGGDIVDKADHNGGDTGGKASDIGDNLVIMVVILVVMMVSILHHRSATIRTDHEEDDVCSVPMTDP